MKNHITDIISKYTAGEATLANAVALCVDLMAKYDIPLENVYRHFDVTGKLCPSYMVDAEKWAEFKARVQKRAADNIPAAYAEDAVAWAVENGVMTGSADGDLMLTQPLTRQQFVTMLYRFHKKYSSRRQASEVVPGACLSSIFTMFYWFIAACGRKQPCKQ